MHFRKRHQTDSEILKYISGHIDKDINRLLNAESLPMGGCDVPDFDKFGVYESLAQRIGRSERRNVWTVCKWACAIALVLLNVGYLAYQNIDLSKPVYKEVCSLKGERLVVLLEDGTRVWLNADSKLVYPEQFAKDKREVSLVGEAYFEVKKDISKPFMVQADEMNIRVTGTSFNVSGYPTDSVVTTTLDEGGIVISYPTIEGETPRAYRIQIERVSDADPRRNLVIRVTDPSLLSATGGIVQGMSGSPILQNGRLVGAVTHVLVNDPTRGYGIFAQTMLEQAKNAVQNGAEAQTAE